MDAAEDRDKALICTAAWTGLRWGELVGLRRECLDLDKATIEVREALVDVGGNLYLSPPKTPGSRRVVRLREQNVAVLKRHVATYPPGQDTLVFTTDRRRPIRDDKLAQAGLEALGGVSAHSSGQHPLPRPQAHARCTVHPGGDEPQEHPDPTRALLHPGDWGSVRASAPGRGGPGYGIAGRPREFVVISDEGYLWDASPKT